MTWEVHVPYRGRDDSLVEVGGFAHHLEGEDRPVARELAMYAAIELGMDTAGELLDHLEASSPAARRTLLDHARQRAGLPTTAEVEAQERFERANYAARLQAGKESPWQLCHAAGCNQIPLGELGIPTTTNVKRWWCPEHRHLAAEGDMQPRPSRLRFSPSGAIVEVDPAEEARQAAAAERRQRQHEEKLAARRVEAAEHEEHKRLRDEAFRRELPPGVPG